MSNTFKGQLPVGLDIAAPHEDGHWISERVSRIVEIIKDYDPNIDVQWIPSEERLSRDPEFRLVTLDNLGKPYIMFFVDNEEKFNESVLARIFQSDQGANPLKLNAIEAHNAAIKAVKMKEKMDELQEAHALARSIWKSPKSKYKHNGVVYE